jgi:hypothetical protein
MQNHTGRQEGKMTKESPRETGEVVNQWVGKPV